MRAPPANAAELGPRQLPIWCKALRSLREASGETQAGWAEKLGVARRTVQRWERAAAVPDAYAERALTRLCEEQQLFGLHATGLLQEYDISPGWLRELLAAARLGFGASADDRSRLGLDAGRLPAPLTSFVGRERELVELEQLLPATRLLTVTGTGGTGKTRLLIAVATRLQLRYPGGVRFVDLAPLADPAQVSDAIARAFGSREPAGVGPTAELSGAAGRKSLLVLDNFEHLVAAAPLIADLLAAAPWLTVLVTSRRPLRIGGEQEYPLAPLPLPSHTGLWDPGAIAQNAATWLFVERAQSIRPNFVLDQDACGAVADLCRRLDGLPLAIELAAAQARLFDPSALSAQLGRRLSLRGGDRSAPARQQTLRDTLAWSYDLLTPPERRVFRRLAVFVGGWSVPAAGAVCAADGDTATDALAGLIDASLIVRAASNAAEPRFTMLENVREFALERLETSGESQAARRAHAEYFSSAGAVPVASLFSPERAERLQRLRPDRANLCAALAWAAANEEAAIGLRLAGGAALWCYSDRPGEGWRHIQRLLDLPAAAETTLVRVDALHVAGALAFYEGDAAALRRFGLENEQAACALGDKWRIANALVELEHLAPFEEQTPSGLALARRRGEAGIALFRKLGDRDMLAWALAVHGNVLRQDADRALAHAAAAESLELCREAGNVWVTAMVTHSLASLALREGDLAGAAAWTDESLHLHRLAEDFSNVAKLLGERGLIALLAGELSIAVARLHESMQAHAEHGDPLGVAWCVRGLAGVVLAQGDADHAAPLLGAADAIDAGATSHHVARWHVKAFTRKTTNAVSTALPPQRYLALQLEGRSLPSAEAVRHALRVVGPGGG